MRQPQYICPVCNFRGLYEPAYDLEYGYGSDDICICCGFQFGLDDFEYPTKEEAHISWREKWRENGCVWYSKSNIGLKPKEWDPIKQLERLNKI